MRIPAFLWITEAELITLFGYILTDMGHYGFFKLRKYRTTSEKMLFCATLLTLVGLIVKWYLF